ncbi:MAG: hypothetical protein QXL94_05940 [Candidatus Parvarchaeum sp.]
MKNVQLNGFLKNYWPLIIAFSILFVPGLIFFSIHPYSIPSCPVNSICSSVHNPMGVLTSIFLFDGIGNIVGAFVYFLVFVLADLMLYDEIKRKRIVFASIYMYVGGVAANLFGLITMPRVIFYGQSGVVYSFMGIVFGFIVLNLFSAVRNVKKGTIKRLGSKKYSYYKRFSLYFNLIFFIIILLEVVIEPSLFLSKALGVDTPIHGVAFLLGILFVLAAGIIKRAVNKNGNF